MRPIDVIKTKIDSDFTKYHGATLCQITSDTDIRNIDGIGLCVLVNPLNAYNKDDPSVKGEEQTFPVMIINRPPKWMETNLSYKYYVLTLNIVQDRPSATIGFLVSKTMLTDMEVFQPGRTGEDPPKTSSGKSLYTKQKEYIDG